MGETTEHYRVKVVDNGARAHCILMQGENGPCPLLGIANVLLLQGKIQISTDYSMVSYEELAQLVADSLLRAASNAEGQSADVQANVQQHVSDAVSYLPHLRVGLDVNVKFRTIHDFEYTQELCVFDVLGINLVHGWLVDPAAGAVAGHIGSRGYNQLVEMAIAAMSAYDEPTPASTAGGEEQQQEEQEEGEQEKDEGFVVVPQEKAQEAQTKGTGSEAEQQKAAEVAMAGQLVRGWLEETASQLTEHGLRQLEAGVQDGELCVFFRNNHFSVLTKRHNALYLLVTDQGYLYERDVVWEKLMEVDGDSYFVDASFQRVGPKQQLASAPQAQGVDRDLELAMSLQAMDYQQQVAVPQQQPPYQQPQPQQQQQQQQQPLIPEGFLRGQEYAAPVTVPATPQQAMPPQHQQPQQPLMQQPQHDQADADFMLAMRLQEEENAAAAQAQAQQQQQPTAAAMAPTAAATTTAAPTTTTTTTAPQYSDAQIRQLHEQSQQQAHHSDRGPVQSLARPKRTSRTANTPEARYRDQASMHSQLAAERRQREQQRRALRPGDYDRQPQYQGRQGGQQGGQQGGEHDADYMLALRLQQEEDQRAYEQQQQQQAPPQQHQQQPRQQQQYQQQPRQQQQYQPQGGRRDNREKKDKKDKNCIIQ